MQFGLEFIRQIQSLRVAESVGVEDFVDRLNFLVTVLILLLSALVVAAKEYFHDPLACYMASNVGGMNLLRYVENYCWVQGTIPIGDNETMPDDNISWDEYLSRRQINYYQWVPFVLGLQCMLFYLPQVIWQMLCYNQAGTNVQSIVATAVEISTLRGNQDQQMTKISDALFDLLKSKFEVKFPRKKQQDDQNGQTGEEGQAKKNKLNVEKGPIGQNEQKKSHFAAPKYFQGYLQLLYGFIKVLYVVNACGQLVLMQHFFGSNGRKLYGISVLVNLINGYDWQTTLIFPRVSFCAVRMRAMGTKSNLATAQCVLTINMLNEKIYIFLWFWILIMAVVNICSLVKWTLHMVLRQKSHEKRLRRYIALKRTKSSVYQVTGWTPKKGWHDHFNKGFQDFAKKFVSQDGVFILRMIAQNAGYLTASELVYNLWEKCKDEYFDKSEVPIVPGPSLGNQPQDSSVKIESG